MTARHLLLALTVASSLAWAQPVPQEPPRGGGTGVGGGIGLQLDLTGLFRAAAALLGGQKQPPPAYAPGQIILAWDDDFELTAETLAATAQAPLRESAHLQTLGLRLAVLEVPDAAVDETLALLRARYPQLIADRHALATLQSLKPARQYAAEHVAAVDLPPLPQPVRIGVIDGDAGASLPPLQVSNWQTARFGQPGVGAEHAAAVVCALACAPDTGFAGLARGAVMLAAAVLRSANGQSVSDTLTLARAFDWLVTQQAQLVNCSLGSAGDAVLARVVARVQQRGVVLVAAAGNGGPVPAPANLPGVIAVAAVDADGNPAAGGSRGPQVTVAAPGVDVWLPVGGGAYFTGSSFAAPFATAWLAHRLSHGQRADAAALCATARDLPPPGRDEASGCGLLQFR